MTIKNRDVGRKFEVKDTLEAGIVLTGAEVKSVRGGHVDLSGSYVKIDRGEATLVNAHISPYSYAKDPDYKPKRSRKLLLHKSEITSLSSKTEHSSLTLVPTELYTIGALIKVKVGVVVGRGKRDRREDLKKRATQRDIEQEIKKYN